MRICIMLFWIWIYAHRQHWFINQSSYQHLLTAHITYPWFSRVWIHKHGCTELNIDREAKSVCQHTGVFVHVPRFFANKRKKTTLSSLHRLSDTWMMAKHNSDTHTANTPHTFAYYLTAQWERARVLRVLRSAMLTFHSSSCMCARACWLSPATSSS